MKYMRELRRKYCDSVIAFLCLLTVLVGGYALTILFAAPEQVPPARGIMATTQMGTFHVTPDILEVCGRAPDPTKWIFHKEDGTIDQDKVVEFSTVLTEWDECVTHYAAILQGFAVGLTTVRDLTMEAAGNYFLEFVPEMAPDEEIPVPDALDTQPGTFQCETCHEDMKR